MEINNIQYESVNVKIKEKQNTEISVNYLRFNVKIVLRNSISSNFKKKVIKPKTKTKFNHDANE